ncbi:DUF2889 domain-containing protein [Variovorax robiniae]|uniref:DUF2889 domain-containing protein n=1 Tax=Variovorax robiniae TaxID=1836199 RepID=A0ABU8XGJ4_9BURK
MHTRRIECQGFQRDDGLYDIEASLRDITPVATDMFFKRLDAGDSIHDMRVVMTVDSALLIHRMEAHTAKGPMEDCQQAGRFYAALEGLRIGPGFKKKVHEIVGGDKGCTHLTELMGPLATTAIQTMYAVRRADGVLRRMLEGTDPLPRPGLAGSCHAYRESGEALKVLWPEHRRDQAVRRPS